MEDLTTITGFLIAIAPVVGLIFKMVREKDTDQHGDAFIAMLEKGVATSEKVAEVIPALRVYVDEGKELVAEAKKIWEGGGYTAQDIKLLEYKYELLQKQIAKDLDALKVLKAG